MKNKCIKCQQIRKASGVSYLKCCKCKQKASDERKKRTKRLIEVGAAVESVLKQPIEKEDLPKLIHFLEQQEERGNYFSKAMK